MARSYVNPSLSSSKRLYLLDSSSTMLFSINLFIWHLFRLRKFLLIIVWAAAMFSGKSSCDLYLLPFLLGRYCWSWDGQSFVAFRSMSSLFIWSWFLSCFSCSSLSCTMTAFDLVARTGTGSCYGLERECSSIDISIMVSSISSECSKIVSSTSLLWLLLIILMGIL